MSKAIKTQLSGISSGKPVGFHILVLRTDAIKQSAGGIILTDETADEDRPFTGEVIGCGAGEPVWSDTLQKWVSPPSYVEAGQSVLYRKYRGIEFKEGEKHYIFLEPKEILAIL